MKHFIGIDPGLNGAIAVYAPEQVQDGIFTAPTRPATLEIYDIPTHGLVVNGKKRRRLAGHSLASIADKLAASLVYAIAYVENVHSMPKQGVASSFSFGFVAGAIQQAIIGAKIPMTLVEPALWKRVLGVPASKDGARLRASQLMPKFAHLWARAKDDGRAEAALIAYYGAKLNAKQNLFS